jgi:hypothetical protein
MARHHFMGGLLFLCVLGWASGASEPPAGGVDPRELRGLTIRDAVARAGMKPKACEIFDEPPGVARGVRGKTADGRTLELWVARPDGVFREKRDWTFAQVAGLRVARVRVGR